MSKCDNCINIECEEHGVICPFYSDDEVKQPCIEGPCEYLFNGQCDGKGGRQ